MQAASFVFFAPSNFKSIIKNKTIMSSFAICHQEKHITNRFVLQGSEPPKIAGSGEFNAPTWISKSIFSLSPQHDNFMKDMDFYSCFPLFSKKINWGLIGAALERWNPLTHTFFFNVGEMTILLDEVEPILNILVENAEISRNKPTYIQECLTPEKILRRMCKNVSDLAHLIKDDEFLLLRKMWDCLEPQLQNEDYVEVKRARVGLVLSVCGALFFPAGNHRMRLENASLVLKHVWGNRGSLAQGILAYLYEGMDSYVLGSKFFGSPYLLQIWLEMHFGKMLEEPFKIVSELQCRSVYRDRFDNLSEDNVVFRLQNHSYVLCPNHDKSPCTLIGAQQFVLYSPQRCCRQVSLNLKVPPPMSHIPALEWQIFDSEEDVRRLNDILLHWECHTNVLKFEEMKEDDDWEEGYSSYFDWYDAFGPKKLAVTEGSVSSKRRRLALK